MTPEEKIREMKRNAKELASAMSKSKAEAALEEEMSNLTELYSNFGTALSESRSKSLRLLENDIDALGWNQPTYVYMVTLDDAGEEVFNLALSAQEHPTDVMDKMRIQGTVKSEVVGAVLVTEFWSYPDSLRDAFGTDAVAYQKWATVLPPSQHPDRVDGRNVIMVDRTGATHCLVRFRNQEIFEVKPDDALNRPEGRVIESMKQLMGLETSLSKTKNKAKALISSLGDVVTILRLSKDEGWTQEKRVEKLTDILMKANPDATRAEMENHANHLFDDMPDEIRKMFGL